MRTQRNDDTKHSPSEHGKKLEQLGEAVLAAGVALALPATAMMSSVAYAGGYGSSDYSYSPKVYHPKPYYPKPYYKKSYTPPPSYTYDGDYPPASCHGENTYEPPDGYSDGCAPPPEWVTYCEHKYQSFNADNGYYKNYDGYYHYCGD